VVANLGQRDEKGRLGIRLAAEGQRSRQKKLIGDVEPEWVEVDASRVRVENQLGLGGPWLALELIGPLGLDDFLEKRPRATNNDSIVRWTPCCLT